VVFGRDAIVYVSDRVTTFRGYPREVRSNDALEVRLRRGGADTLVDYYEQPLIRRQTWPLCVPLQGACSNLGDGPNQNRFAFLVHTLPGHERMPTFTSKKTDGWSLATGAPK
jgi:hypothetical protein